MLSRLKNIFADRSPRGKRHLALEIEAELEFHVEMRVDDLMRKGLSEKEARAKAKHLFGDRKAIRERCLYVSETDPLRRLMRQCTNAGMYGLGCALLIVILFLSHAALVKRPSTFPAQGNWNLVHHQMPDGSWSNNHTLEQFDLLSSESEVFDRVTAARYETATLKANGPARKIRFKEVSENYFKTHGVNALHGALFSDMAGDHSRIASTGLPAVILSEEFWHSEYGGASGTLGKTLKINGRSFRITGILPASFQMYSPTDVFIQLERSRYQYAEQASFLIAARLKNGFSATSANTYFKERIDSSHSYTWLLQSITDVYAGPLKHQLWLYMMVFGLVGLALSMHFGARIKDVGIAGLLLGILFSAVLAASAIPFLAPVILGPESRLFILEITPRVFVGLISGAVIITSIIFGFLQLSAIAIARFRGMEAREQTNRGSERSSWSVAVVGGVCLFVLALAVDAVKSDLQFRALGSNLDLESFVTSLHFGAVEGTQDEQFAQLIRVSQELDKRESLTAFSIASFVPDERTNDRMIDVIGKDETISGESATHLAKIGTDFLSVMNVSFLEGQDFDQVSRDERSKGVIINQSLADNLWPGQSAVGKQIQTKIRGTELTVIGVVENHISRNALSKNHPLMYVWFWRYGMLSPTFYIDSEADVKQVSAAVRESVDAVNADIAFTPLVVAGNQLALNSRRLRLRTVFLVGMALLMLILSVKAFRDVVSSSSRLSMDRLVKLRSEGASNISLATQSMFPGIRLLGGGLLVGFMVICFVFQFLPEGILEAVSPSEWTIIPSVLAIVVAAVVFSSRTVHDAIEDSANPAFQQVRDIA